MFNTQQRHGSKRKEEYKELANGCAMYDPCEINFECKNKASHLYVRCQECPVPFAKHNYKVRERMINRDNFSVSVTDETFREFQRASEQLAEKEEMKVNG